MGNKNYPTDLTDSEWAIIEPLLPSPKSKGRSRTTDLRQVINAILYLLHEGCQWRALPHDFPAWSTVRTYFDKWHRRQIWGQINSVLRERLRRVEGRKPEPTAGSIDSQSVKTTEKKGMCMAMMGVRESKAEKDMFW